jgi:hypothetical protein
MKRQKQRRRTTKESRVGEGVKGVGRGETQGQHLKFQNPQLFLAVLSAGPVHTGITILGEEQALQPLPSRGVTAFFNDFFPLKKNT